MQRYNRLEPVTPTQSSSRRFSFSLVQAGRQICCHMTLLSPVLLGPCSEVGKISFLLMLCWYSYWQDPAGGAFSARVPCDCNWPVSPPTCTFLSRLFLWFYLIFCSTSWDSQYHNQFRLFSIPQDTNYKESRKTLEHWVGMGALVHNVNTQRATSASSRPESR